MLRIPHCLENQLIDGGKVVNPTRRPRFTPSNLPIAISVIHTKYRKYWLKHADSTEMA
jgi:hypothetical protein